MGEKIIESENITVSTESKSADTARTGTRTDTRTDTRTGRGRTGTTEKETEKSDKLLSVDKAKQAEPLKVEISGLASVAEEKTTEKTKRTRKPRQKKESKPETTQFNLLIATVSGLIASKDGMEHWSLTQKEIESISEPLANIIANNENLKALSEHTDATALVIACFTIFVPRLIITTNKKKEKKKREITGNVTDTTVKSDKKGKTERSSNTDVKRPATNNVSSSIDLSWLGDAVM